MNTTVKIRRDEDGTTEEAEATLTAGGSTVNIHFREVVELHERDVLMIDAEALRLLIQPEP